MAAWKPKEKPLTEQEAVALARKELAKYWFGFEPLLAGIRSGEAFSAYPLDPEFSKRAWLFVFADPTTYAGEAALDYAREWQARYAQHGLGLIVIFRQPYQKLQAKETVQLMMRKRQLECITVIDADGSLAEAFDAKSLPKMMLMDKTARLFEQAGAAWTQGAELQLQKFLRGRDPGLALFEPYVPARALGADQASIELRAGAEAPGVAWAGEWKRDEACASTNDPRAEMRFKSAGPRVSVVAQSLSKLSDPARVAVEVNGVPAFDSWAGESLVLSDDGLSEARVDIGNLYHLLAGLPPESREITLRFPYADRIPVGVYGLRIGS